MMTAWRPPIHGAMPPSEAQQRCVMFVCADVDGERVPCGTAFLVGLPGEDGAWFKYFITAAHVVRGDEPRWIRLRRHDGKPPEDIRISEWFLHPTSEIAATPCDFDTNPYIANYQEERFFCDKHPFPNYAINIGERAFFIGLLANVRSMADRAIPMMRGGSIGAMHVQNVPMLSRRNGFPDYTTTEPRAHLIDCFSRSGFSGSPVYVDHAIVKVWRPKDVDGGEDSGPVPHSRIASQVDSLSALFGVLVGHFSSSSGDNSGVAIVVPVDVLRDLLEDRRLVAWREQEAERIRERRRLRQLEDIGVFDSSSTTAGGTNMDVDAIATDTERSEEFTRFEDLTRKLLAVPKAELDALREKERGGPTDAEA